MRCSRPHNLDFLSALVLLCKVTAYIRPGRCHDAVLACLQSQRRHYHLTST